jgi:hypothetical protein
VALKIGRRINKLNIETKLIGKMIMNTYGEKQCTLFQKGQIEKSLTSTSMLNLMIRNIPASLDPRKVPHESIPTC